MPWKLEMFVDRTSWRRFCGGWFLYKSGAQSRGSLFAEVRWWYHLFITYISTYISIYIAQKFPHIFPLFCRSKVILWYKPTYPIQMIWSFYWFAIPHNDGLIRIWHVMNVLSIDFLTLIKNLGGWNPERFFLRLVGFSQKLGRGLF